MPYFGIGWNTNVTTDTGMGFEFDLGTLFQGTPAVKLTATGAITINSQFQSDLAAEEVKLQGDLNSFKTYPVIGVGLTCRF